MDTPVLPARIYRYVVMLRRAEIEADIAEDGPGRWTLTVKPEELAEGDALAVVFKRRRNGRIARDIEVVVGGERQDTADLMQAIARLMQRKSEATSTPAVAGRASAARSNSVETRRATVIRV